MIRILTIDDNGDNLISLRAMIEDSFPKSAILATQSGKEGVELATAHDPDVILLDILMPEMDGFEVCHRLKRDEKTRDIPVVFLTAVKDDRASRIKALELGAEAFLSKPIDMTELTAQIRAMVKIKAANVSKRDEQGRLERLVAERTSELERSHSAMLNLMEDLKAENDTRKGTEAALRETRDYLDNLITYANTPIIVWDPDFLITRFNRAFQVLTGLSESDAIGKPLAILFPPGAMDASMRKIRGSVGERWETEEFPILDRRTGKVSTVLWNSAYVLGKDGSSVVATIAQGTDITARNSAESALTERERFLSATLETAQDGFLVVDGEGKIAEANGAYCRMSGYSKEELRETCFTDIDASENSDDALRRIVRIRENGSEIFEVRHRRKDGGAFDVEISAAYLDSGSGKVICFCRDITARKGVEAELKRTTRQLEQCFEQSTVAMVLSGMPDTEFRLINPACRELLGIEDEPSYVGTRLSEFVPSYRDYDPEGAVVPVDRRPLGRALSGEKTINEEHRIVRKDDTTRWVLASSAPIRDSRGEILAGYLILVDITERRHAEEKVRDLLGEKELMLKETHHRVKNNMNAVFSLLNVQAMRQASDSSRSVLNDAAGRVKGMMLLYDKLYRSDNFIELSVKQFLPNLVAEIVNLLRVFPSIGTEIRVEDFALNANILAPIGIIINELITNTMKYAFVGRESGLITVSAEKKGNKVALFYKDDGIGLPETVSFDAGSGFGMQLIDLLVRQIDGSISIDRGDGTAFTIEFEVGQSR